MATVEIDGRTVSYTDSGGDGPAVVLVHAFPFNASMWDGQVQALQDYRVICPDLPGFGDSADSDDPSTYSMDRWADDVAGVMDDAGVERAVVGSCSMGGYVTFALLRRHRDKISSLLLIDTKAEADGDEAKAKRATQQEQLRGGGIEALKDGLTMGLIGPTTRENDPGLVKEIRSLMDDSATAYIGALEGMKGRPDSSGDITGLDLPTLIIVGEEDGVTPPEAARAMHELIGGSKLVVLPQTGHLTGLEAPEEVNSAILGFLGSL